MIQRPIPDASVVIPTRDRWPLLPRALASVLDQEAVSVEIIVVDDGSDEPEPPIEAVKDPRVTVLRHDRQLGTSAARNTGVERARAPWIGFLDDDDIWAPRKLISALECVHGTGADFCYSAAVVVDPRLRLLGLQPAPPAEGLLRTLLQHNAIPGGGSSVVANAAVLTQIGGFDESLSYVEDWDLWIRLAERGRPAAIPEVLVAYSHHLGGWVLRGDPAIRANLELLATKHRDVAEQEGVTVDAIGHERSLAYSQHLAGRRMAATRRYLSIARRHRDVRDLARAAGSLIGSSWLAHLRIRRLDVPRPEWLDRYRRYERGTE